MRGVPTVLTKDDHVKEYLGILKQLRLVISDSTKDKVEHILMACRDEFEMSRKLHDVWCGDKTIQQFIEQYGG